MRVRTEGLGSLAGAPAPSRFPHHVCRALLRLSITLCATFVHNCATLDKN